MGARWVVPLLAVGILATGAMHVVAAKLQKGEAVYIAGSSVNVRSGPRPDAGIVVKLSIGTKVTFDHESGPWAHVSVPGQTSQAGYVAADLLTREPPRLEALLAQYDRTPETNYSERRKWAERAAALDPTAARAETRLLAVLQDIGDRAAYAAAGQAFLQTWKPHPATDGRGWIDAWALRADVEHVERLGRGVPFTDARTALNDAWRPVLHAAMQRGDPVAEVVLRACDTSRVIDRTGIETDCSNDEASHTVAQARLEAVGFGPALSRLNTEAVYATIYGMTPGKPWKRRRDAATGINAAFETMLDAMHRGDLAVSEHLNFLCYSYRGDEYERCKHLFHMVQAVCGKAKRFFTAGQVTRSGGYANLSHLSLYRPRAGPMDRFEVRDEAIYPSHLRSFAITDVDAFRLELDQRLEKLEASITDDLKREPRWAVFLIERDGTRIRPAVPDVSKAQ